MEKPLEPNHYRCEHCGGVFKSTWPDNEAMNECVATFGPMQKESMAIVCDDCYQAIVAWEKRQPRQ